MQQHHEIELLRQDVDLNNARSQSMLLTYSDMHVHCTPLSDNMAVYFLSPVKISCA